MLRSYKAEVPYSEQDPEFIKAVSVLKARQLELHPVKKLATFVTRPAGAALWWD